MTRVPDDPNMSKEFRRFLDDLVRNQTFRNLITDTITVGGLNPFLQGGTADEGLDHTPIDHETVSSGTLTIDPLDGYFHEVINGGAFVLSPTASRWGSCVLHITNNGSAGAVTFTGWTKKYPSPSLNTTNTNKFAIFMFFYGSYGADYTIQPRQ